MDVTKPQPRRLGEADLAPENSADLKNEGLHQRSGKKTDAAKDAEGDGEAMQVYKASVSAERKARG